MLNLTKLYLYRMLRTKVAWVCMMSTCGAADSLHPFRQLYDRQNDGFYGNGR